jgi:hypothetical protein
VRTPIIQGFFKKCSGIGDLKDVGVLEYWSNGVLEFWSGGLIVTIY